jgi:two-component system, chemotaxis family, protein-glutamate methylesterase/glutaminase
MPDTTAVPQGFNSTAQTPETADSGGDCLGHLETCHSRPVSTDPDTTPVLVPSADAFPIAIPVLALVTSAGGLNALIHVLAPLPADLTAAVLVVQHQSPDRPSNSLAHILDARTALRVRAAHDGDHLQPGHVLVTPPATHMIVTPTSALALIDSGQLPPSRPSADLLLATLAVTCGPRALAVVLTGHGHDAHAGIRAVHRCGGLVLAQDKATAEAFGMPAAAIATGLVHAVLPLSELPALIIRQLRDRARKTVS